MDGMSWQDLDVTTQKYRLVGRLLCDSSFTTTLAEYDDEQQSRGRGRKPQPALPYNRVMVRINGQLQPRDFLAIPRGAWRGLLRHVCTIEHLTLPDGTIFQLDTANFNHVLKGGKRGKGESGLFTAETTKMLQRLPVIALFGAFELSPLRGMISTDGWTSDVPRWSTQQISQMRRDELVINEQVHRYVTADSLAKYRQDYETQIEHRRKSKAAEAELAGIDKEDPQYEEVKETLESAQAARETMLSQSFPTAVTPVGIEFTRHEMILPRGVPKLYLGLLAAGLVRLGDDATVGGKWSLGMGRFSLWYTLQKTDGHGWQDCGTLTINSEMGEYGDHMVTGELGDWLQMWRDERPHPKCYVLEKLVLKAQKEPGARNRPRRKAVETAEAAE